jgi:hypothetical protein
VRKTPDDQPFATTTIKTKEAIAVAIPIRRHNRTRRCLFMTFDSFEHERQHIYSAAIKGRPPGCPICS